MNGLIKNDIAFSYFLMYFWVSFSYLMVVYVKSLKEFAKSFTSNQEVRIGQKLKKFEKKI